MKVAVTFFRNKRKKYYKRINDIQKKYVNINTFDSIEIKKYEILMVLFLSIFIVLNSSELVY